MSSDLKIEIFSYHVFYKAMKFPEDETDNVPNILHIYGDECAKDNSYLEACDITFLNAINCRIFLFSKIFLEELDLNKAMNLQSPSECYDHLTRICNSEDLFGHLSIFERMLATCAFALFASICVFSYSPINVKNYVRIIWTMHFDKFTKTFYEEGGWKMLKRVAKRYDLLNKAFIFLRPSTIPKSFLHRSKKASVNYNKFKDSIMYGDCKYKGKGHISKHWVKFNVEHFEEYVIIPLNYEDSVDCLDIELLLKDLKVLFDSISAYDTKRIEILEKKHQDIICTTGMPHAETIDSCEDIKNNGYIRIQNPVISETLHKEPPDSIKDLETKSQEEFIVYFEKDAHAFGDFKTDKKFCCRVGPQRINCEVNLDEYSHKTCDSLNDRILSQQLETSKEYSYKISDLDVSHIVSLESNNENDLHETSSQRNVRHLSKIRNTTDVLTTDGKDEGLKHNKYPPKDLSNPLNSCSETESSKSHIGKEMPEIGLESTFNVRTERCNKDTEITNTLYTNQMAVNLRDRNSFSPKGVANGNEAEKNYDGRIDINKNLNTLSEEKNDPEIGNFLRMILIFNDRKVMQYVRKSSGCSEES